MMFEGNGEALAEDIGESGRSEAAAFAITAN